MALALQIAHISKRYDLGQIGTGTVARDLQRWWITAVQKKQDPFLRIGEQQTASNQEIWSLKDVSIDVEQGTALGIIGRNGAGKSTLLKILSGITTPTSGRVCIKGRMASLLEVGTGFHPELTGRENIFLNGAILGMRKAAIRNQLDAIIDFSGVESFIDTPVKRYSSGMYVRLAFAVAAHLQSDILIVDEVLAVGDAAFQKKCLSKMNAVQAAEGRTVLFVSHQIAAIQALCNQAMLLEQGQLTCAGPVQEVLQTYQQSVSTGDAQTVYQAAPDANRKAAITRVAVLNEQEQPAAEFDVFAKRQIDLQFSVNETLTGSTAILALKKDGVELFWSFLSDEQEETLNQITPGKYQYRITLPEALKKGQYSIDIRIARLRVEDYDVVTDAVQFYVDEFSFDPAVKSFTGSRPGIIPALLKWERR